MPLMYGLEDRTWRIQEVESSAQGPSSFLPQWTYHPEFGPLRTFCLEVSAVIIHRCGRIHRIGPDALV